MKPRNPDSVIPFATTGIQTSRIGLGLAALGRPGYINLGHSEDLDGDYDPSKMEARTHRILDLAYTLGIRYFDAARSYGKAEQFLHSWLQSKKHIDDLVVGSKWGYTYTANWQVEADKHEVKEHSLPVLKRQWERSKQLLPYLQLYQIHSATFESGVLDNQEVLQYLSKLKRDFGIKIGLSLSGTNQGEVLQEASLKYVNKNFLFDTVQITYNILEQSAASAIKEAAGRGMNIIVKEVLANGRLTARNQAPGFQERHQQLSDMAQKYEISMDALAIAFVLAQPWSHLVLSGAAREDHLKSNIKALDVTLEQTDLQQLEGLAMPAASYWKERSALVWN